VDCRKAQVLTHSKDVMKKIEYITLEEFKEKHKVDKISIYTSKKTGKSYGTFPDNTFAGMVDDNLDYNKQVYCKHIIDTEENDTVVIFTNEYIREEEINKESSDTKQEEKQIFNKVYITIANSIRILKKINLDEIEDIDDEIYFRPIYFFSKKEAKRLLLIKSFYKEPEKFAFHIYKPIANEDTLKYVYESEQPPAYHIDNKCERLLSDFKNFQIPFEIKHRAQEKAIELGMSDEDSSEFIYEQVRKFRDWFKIYENLFKEDLSEFLKKLDINWNIQRNIEEIELKNSGVLEYQDYDLKKLENEINGIIDEANNYFSNNKNKQQIIKKFQKLTFLAYISGEIYNNDSGLSDNDLKEFLKYYDETYKKRTVSLLIEYYRVKYNPELSFEGYLLERLNFKPCGTCNRKSE